MKKNILRIIAGIMTIFMVFALAACSTPEELPEEQTAIDPEMAVKEYVELFKDAVAEKSQDGKFSIELEARGTSLVYKYTFADIDNLEEEQFNAIKETFEQKAETEKDAYLENLKAVQSEQENITSIIFEYYEKSGKLISSIEVK